MLINFPWPGNVRRLINTLEHSAVTCKGDTIEVSDLPEYLVNEKMPAHIKLPPDEEGSLDREKISTALSQCKGNKTLTAKQLGISRVTLWKKIKSMGIE